MQARAQSPQEHAVLPRDQGSVAASGCGCGTATRGRQRIQDQPCRGGRAMQEGHRAVLWEATGWAPHYHPGISAPRSLPAAAGRIRAHAAQCGSGSRTRGPSRHGARWQGDHAAHSRKGSLNISSLPGSCGYASSVETQPLCFRVWLGQPVRACGALICTCL